MTTVTGLFLLPIAPNQTSPLPVLTSHISRSHRSDLLSTYYLEHRLFVDTSSLLPNAELGLRRYTSLLTLSHQPAVTYVETSRPQDKTTHEESRGPPAGGSRTMVTMPTSAADNFIQLVATKFQPHWAPRQSLVVENGSSFSLQDGSWTVRVGDLKTPARQGTGAGSNIRGMLLEISLKAPQNDGPEDGARVDAGDETYLRGFVDALAEGTGVSLEHSRALFRHTGPSASSTPGTGSPDADWNLAELYMDLLGGSR